MTKAKTKSRRVWLANFPHWYTPDVYFSRERCKTARAAFGPGLEIIPATLTWTPPAIWSKNGRYAHPGPVPDDARGYAEARCLECLANPGGFDGPTGAE